MLIVRKLINFLFKCQQLRKMANVLLDLKVSCPCARPEGMWTGLGVVPFIPKAGVR
jgi:hypothetical protein